MNGARKNIVGKELPTFQLTQRNATHTSILNHMFLFDFDFFSVLKSIVIKNLFSFGIMTRNKSIFEFSYRNIILHIVKMETC